MSTPFTVQRPAAGTTHLWAAHAWVERRWHDAVAFEITPDGHWGRIAANSPRPTPGAAGTQAFDAPLVAPLVNAHSHAFQRAFAGLAERRTREGDDFWSWREQMYSVALAITPAELRRTATALYRELLAGGYAHVCEFHYLHHAPDGSPYPASQGGALAMSRALVDAAQDAGMGLTLLPVLYERAGFAQPQLAERQRRFGTDVNAVLTLRDAVHGLARSLPGGSAPLHAGIAVHSLRAARRESILELARRVQDDDHPIHLHIGEQTAEVHDCLAATGQRPIEWLCNGLPAAGDPPGSQVRPGLVDARWHLVHATHATGAEIAAVAACGAHAVLCPTTEANLGDGLTDLRQWLERGVGVGLGSDSHVCRDVREELRLAEYGQRLLHRQRHITASRAEPSCAQRLYECALSAGAAAAGLPRWGFVAGARAQWIALPGHDLGRPLPHGQWLDAAVFSTP